MRNKKALFAGALMVPALALTGGVAYATTTTGGPATPARTAVTTTVQPTSQHTTGPVIHNRCDWRYGDHRCDWNGHRCQVPVTQRQTTQRHAYRHHANRSHHGYQGGWGYQGGDSGNHQGDGCCW